MEPCSCLIEDKFRTKLGSRIFDQSRIIKKSKLINKTAKNLFIHGKESKFLPHLKHILIRQDHPPTKGDKTMGNLRVVRGLGKFRSLMSGRNLDPPSSSWSGHNTLECSKSSRLCCLGLKDLLGRVGVLDQTSLSNNLDVGQLHQRRECRT